MILCVMCVPLLVIKHVVRVVFIACVVVPTLGGGGGNINKTFLLDCNCVRVKKLAILLQSIRSSLTSRAL